MGHDVYICYDDASLASDTTVNCDYYYLKNKKKKKCTNPAGCKAKNYIYLIVTAGTSEKECKDRCDEYYKYETSIQIGSNDVTFFECYLSNRIGQHSQVVDHLAKANSFFFDVKKNDKFTTADEKISLELKNAVDSIKQTVFKNRKCK